jgi:hypothetical protein
VNLLAVPVAAWVARQQRDPEARSHGALQGRFTPAPELAAEEPFVEIDAVDPRENPERRDGR